MWRKTAAALEKSRQSGGVARSSVQESKDIEVKAYEQETSNGKVFSYSRRFGEDKKRGRSANPGIKAITQKQVKLDTEAFPETATRIHKRLWVCKASKKHINTNGKNIPPNPKLGIIKRRADREAQISHLSSKRVFHRMKHTANVGRVNRVFDETVQAVRNAQMEREEVSATEARAKYKNDIANSSRYDYLARNLQLKENRARIRHVRSLRLQRLAASTLSRATSGHVSGPVIGNGPLPLRALALSKDKGAKREHAPHDKTGKGRPSYALAKVFSLIRRFAATADNFYLDFDAAFRAFDQNKDGFVNEDDFSRVLYESNIIVSDEDFDLLWNFLDKNGNGVITKGEFVSSFFNHRALLAQIDEKRGYLWQMMQSDADEQMTYADLTVTVHGAHVEQRARRKSPPDTYISLSMRGKVTKNTQCCVRHWDPVWPKRAHVFENVPFGDFQLEDNIPVLKVQLHDDTPGSPERIIGVMRIDMAQIKDLQEGQVWLPLFRPNENDKSDDRTAKVLLSFLAVPSIEDAKNITSSTRLSNETEPTSSKIVHAIDVPTSRLADETRGEILALLEKFTCAQK